MNFWDLPIFPNLNSLQNADDIWLLNPNVTQGPYRSAHDYIETHFRLLREDFMSPLRAGIDHLRSASLKK